MLNFDHDLLFHKRITIGDALNSGNLLATASFMSRGEQTVSATVSFQRLSDRTPVSGETVAWSFLDGRHIVETGKTSTDRDGRISVSTSYKGDPNELILTANVVPGASKPIIHSFRVQILLDKPDLQFFPEGGRMVAGLRSKVAFKALQSDGSSLDVKGYIVDENGNRILDFASEHAGMGVFAFLPQMRKTYTALLKSREGKICRYPLPPAEAHGHILSMNFSGEDSVAVNVKSTAPIRNSNSVSLMALQNGNVEYLTKIEDSGSSVSFRIPSSRFETGIVQFTLFSADEKPLAERLLFINHHDHLQLNAESKPVYGRGRKCRFACRQLISRQHRYREAFQWRLPMLSMYLSTRMKKPQFSPISCSART